MSGPVVMAERTTIATVMGTPPVCGPSALIPPSMMVKTPITMRAARQHWLALSVMAPRIPTREW